MIFARQSTAIIVTVGPVLDSSGVAVTTSVVGDFLISKNGAAPAALNGSATLTHRNTGHYSLSLTATDVNTVGTAEVVINATTNACPIKEITVVEPATYDVLFADAAPGPASPTNITAGTITTATNVTTVNGLAANVITAASIATGAIDADAIADNAIDAGAIAADAITSAKIANGAIDAATFAAGAIDAAALAADAGTEIGTAVWATAARTLTAATNITSTGGTTVPQTGDSFARIGATGSGLTSLSSQASVDTIDGIVDAILLDTAEIGAAGVGLTNLGDARLANLDAAISTRMATFVYTAPDNASIAAILADTGTDGVVVAAASKTGYRLSSTGVDDILDEIIEGTTSLRAALRGYNAALLSKASGLATTTAVFRDIDDTKDRITATVDASGNRTAITLDLA